MADLDDGDARGIQGARDGRGLRRRELVAQGVGAIAQRRIGQAIAARGLGSGAGVRLIHHAVTPKRSAASVSPTRTADAVMMSRLPANGGR